MARRKVTLTAEDRDTVRREIAEDRTYAVSELPTSALAAWCYVRSPRPLATWQREAICRTVRTLIVLLCSWASS